jgi:predicted CoA-binding protein
MNIRDLLRDAATIAVVGMSDDEYMTSYQVGTYLREHGYTVYPVNPWIHAVDGYKACLNLDSVPEPIDIVVVFRDSSHLMDIVKEAITADAGAVWAQEGVIDEEAFQKAQESDMPMVMDECIRTHHQQLFGGRS